MRRDLERASAHLRRIDRYLIQCAVVIILATAGLAPLSDNPVRTALFGGLALAVIAYADLTGHRRLVQLKRQAERDDS